MSLSQTLAALDRLAQHAVDPQDPVFHALTANLAATTGIHPTSVARLTELWATHSRAPALRRAVLRAGLDRSDWQPLGSVAIVAPGNVFVATWQVLCESLLVGNRVRIRPAEADPFAAEHFRDALALVDPELAARIELDRFTRGDVARWQQFLHGMDALVVQGSDPGVAAVVQRAGQAGFVGRLRSQGEMVACALIDPETFAADHAFAQMLPGLAHDALLADGRGCMSLRAIHVLGEHPVALWSRRHAQLAETMRQTAVALPRGQIGPDRALVAQLALDHAEFQTAQDPDAHLTRGVDWWLATSPHANLRPGAQLGPGARGLLLQGVGTLSVWLTALQPWRGRISVVAVAPGVRAESLDSLGIIRLCAPGQMQAPPCDRAPDGHLPLAGLVRWLDR
jgi:hypothetical protein